MEGITEFLKYSCISQITKEDDDPIQNIDFELLHDVSMLKRNVGCTELLFACAVLERNMGNFVQSSPPLYGVMDDCKTKLLLFMWNFQRLLEKPRRIYGIRKIVMLEQPVKI